MWAESRRVVEATHKNSNGSTDYGLMQSNSIHGKDPGRLLSDPLYNADCAHEIYSAAGNSWGPWSTYHNGTYITGQTADTSSTLVLPADLGHIGGRGMSVSTSGINNPRQIWENVKTVAGGVKGAVQGTDHFLNDPMSAIKGPVNKYLDDHTGLGGVNTALGKITNRTTWRHIGIGALGISLVIVGLILFLGPTIMGQTTVGKVAKVAGKVNSL